MKIYYSISEVTQMTQLPASTLRYWEKQFGQLQPYKNEKGTRFYTEQDIELIKKIKFVRDDLRITRIDAIKKELRRDSRKTDSRQRSVELLRKIRFQLEELRRNI
ncbi:MAG: MerR family transcriptional regulator [Paludibacteraceae bacterium]|nr:MerR family transcriptional regulator [Paludibacteraceae bacterium]